MPVLKKPGAVFRGEIIKIRISARTFAARNPAFLLAAGLILILMHTARPVLNPIPGADMHRPFTVKAVITSLPEKSSYGYLLTLKPVSLSQQGLEFKFNQKIILKLSMNTNQVRETSPGNLFMGDTVVFRGILERPSYNLIPGTADRRFTAEMEGIPFFIRLKSFRQIRKIILPLKPEAFIFGYLEKFIYSMEHKCPDETMFLMRSLLMGQKRALPTRVREQVNRLGITHLFVISGFHIGILTAMLHFLFRKKRAAAAGIIPVIIWTYVWIIGFPIPASRAAVIVSLFIVLLYFGIQKNLLNALGIAALTLLFLNPASVFLPGFQLTFGCLLAIIWLAVPLMGYIDSPVRGYQVFLENQVVAGRSRTSVLTRFIRTWIEDHFRQVPARGRKAGLIFLRLFSWLMKAIGCTAAIQFFLFPLLIFYFNSFNFISLPATALFMPFITILIFTGLLLLGLWWSPFSGPLCLLYRFTSEIILRMIEACDSIFPPLLLSQPNLTVIIIFYIFLMAMLSINPSRGWIFPLIMLAAFFSWGRVTPAETEKNILEISMLDVGQGDCFHIRYPDGNSGLIDAGGTVYEDNEMFIGKNLIARYLWETGVKKLDYLLITHPEKDHSAGYHFLNSAFSIRNLYFHDPHPSYKSPGLRLSAGDSFTVGGIHHQVIWPDKDFGQEDNLNDRSLVILLTYGRFKILFTGDISEGVEKILLKKKELTGVKVLKVSHHGSNSSSCRLFLEGLRAETAIISAGRRNSFGHTSPQAVKRLEAAGMKIYSTPEHGTVKITTDGLTWKTHTQAEE